MIDIRGASRGRAKRGGRSPIPIPGGVAVLGGGAGLVVSGGGGGFDLQNAFGTGTGAPGAGNPAPIPPAEDPQRDLKDFSTYVSSDAQRTWSRTLGSGGYERAQLVLYSDAVNTEGCGSADSAVGPF